jgi:hypothetical protein
MKYIITESQHNRLKTQQWLLRRYDLLMSEYDEAVTELDPCNYDESERYVNRAIHYIVDGLHPQYYLIDNFDYDLLFNIIINMFYDDLTNRYQDKKERC